MTATTHRPGLRRLASALVLPVLALTACSGESEDDRTPEEVLAGAKTELDETSGVSLELEAAEGYPKDVDLVVYAKGIGTHAPAFEGDLKLRVNNLSIDVPVIAVNGQVFAQLPFTTKYNEVEPEEYGAPDPASLMDNAAGISSWLTALEGVEEGDQTRDGDKVLTTYTGTLPGTAVAEVIPSALPKEDFEATFSIDDEGRLDTARLVGPFYGDSGDVDYTFTLDDYGTDKDITRP